MSGREGEAAVLKQFKQGRSLDVVRDDGTFTHIFLTYLDSLSWGEDEGGWAVQAITRLGRVFRLPLSPFPTEAEAQAFAQACVDARQTPSAPELPDRLF